MAFYNGFNQLVKHLVESIFFNSSNHVISATIAENNTILTLLFL